MCWVRLDGTDGRLFGMELGMRRDFVLGELVQTDGTDARLFSRELGAGNLSCSELCQN